MIPTVAQAGLLELARSAIRAHLEKAPASELAAPNLKLNDADFGGVFVSLYGPGSSPESGAGSELRGCTGLFSLPKGLAGTVAAQAVHAATKDSRFPPLTLTQLPGTRLELSILSAPKPLADPGSLILGRHGIVIRGVGEHEGRGGVYLPQVAEKLALSEPADFLDHCCERKARLPAGVWRDPKQTRVSVFTAVVFGDGVAQEADGA